MELQKNKPYTYSKWIMASYGAREMFGSWITGAFAFSVYYFYEAVVGLNSWMAGLAFLIYSIWDAINDPVIGYLMDRIHMPWENKRGMRRFPWIIFGAITWLASYILIFMVPIDWVVDGKQWWIFFWYVISLCLYDTMLTIYEVNGLALYPDKFQSSNERLFVQGAATILGIIGIVLSAVIPPMWVTKELESYRTMALLSVGIGILFLLLILPGMYEDKRLRGVYRNRKAKVTGDHEDSFLKTIKMLFSNRHFVGKITFHFGYCMSSTTLQMSAFYILVFLLDRPETDLILLMVPMLVGALISTPLWLVVTKKANNNKKISLLAGIMMFISFIPMFFVTSIEGWMVCISFFGIALGGQWFMDPPTFADIIDDAVVTTGKHQESAFYGIQTFIVRFAGVFQALMFSIVHSLTTFPEGVNTLEDFLLESENPPLALFGIRVLCTIIPAFVILITIFVFWKLFNISPEKAEQNKKILAER